MSQTVSTAFDAKTIAGAVKQPPLETLGNRARRRRRKRNMVAAAASVGTAAVVVSVTAQLANGSALSSTIGGTPAGVETPSSPHGAEVARVQLIVLDPQTIVSVRQNDCAVVFKLSADTGQTWTTSRGPVPWRECDTARIPLTDFAVLGPESYEATVDDKRYITLNAGATWQPWNLQAEKVDAFPAGIDPLDCLSGCSDDAFRVLDPVKGKLQELRTLPPLQHRWTMRSTPDGSIWVTGSDATKSESRVESPEVVRSADRGKTWHPTVLPDGATDIRVLPASKQEAYMLANHDGTSRLYRTTDGGINWTDTNATGLLEITAWTIGANGTVLIAGIKPDTHTDESFVQYSTDQGQTFSGPMAFPELNQTAQISSVTGALWTVGQDGVTHVTKDGQSWQNIRPPA
jgi:hypothetical protein